MAPSVVVTFTPIEISGRLASIGAAAAAADIHDLVSLRQCETRRGVTDCRAAQVQCKHQCAHSHRPVDKSLSVGGEGGDARGQRLSEHNQFSAKIFSDAQEAADR